MFICISWCLSDSRGWQEQALFLYILILPESKPFSHKTSRNRYREIIWKKKQQVSQVTYRRYDMDIAFKCPCVPE